MPNEIYLYFLIGKLLFLSQISQIKMGVKDINEMDAAAKLKEFKRFDPLKLKMIFNWKQFRAAMKSRSHRPYLLAMVFGQILLVITTNR